MTRQRGECKFQVRQLNLVKPISSPHQLLTTSSSAKSTGQILSTTSHLLSGTSATRQQPQQTVSKVI